MVRKWLLLVVMGAIVAASSASYGCSRYLWNRTKLGTFSARTMDWPESTEPVLLVLPQGMARDGGKVGTEVVEAQNPARWTSKYGSLVTSIYGIGSADGFNEKGLAMHMLFLNAADFGPRDLKRPAVHAGLWGQYLLDNAASVGEALELMQGIQIVMASSRGHNATVHLAIEDAAGDSAILEIVSGKLNVYHGKEHCIMTNDPPYDQQLELLKKQDFSKPTSDTPLPGNVKATDRFQRLAYYSAMLPEPESEREAIASLLAIVRNVSVPFGAPYKGFGIYNTEYRTVINLTGTRYYFELTTSPNVIWADLGKFDLKPGSPVMSLNPRTGDFSGNASASFTKVEAQF